MIKSMWNGIIKPQHFYFPDIYSRKSRWKLLLLLVAVCIGAGSLLYTHRLVGRLALEERKKVELWAEATRILAQATDESHLDFLLKVIENNSTVPVLLTDEKDSVIYLRNIDTVRAHDHRYLRKELAMMKKKHIPIQINLTPQKRNYIYYNDSLLITQLTFYPYVQLFVILIFILVAYMAFSVSRSAEQNKVWLGLSRETAHQLGTPTSSLMAWVELLKEHEGIRDITRELEKDVQRLYTITERFSKIGSEPVLELKDLVACLEEVVSYMQHRTPKSVKITLISEDQPIYAFLNTQLFGWVIENMIKNSLDAIKSQGFIAIRLLLRDNFICIDVEDNGRGIAGRDVRKVFKPGFTTKKRGWGLGLSLSKRIIENYHRGKISVLHSAVNAGTTFRIMLPLKQMD